MRCSREMIFMKSKSRNPIKPPYIPPVTQPLPVPNYPIPATYQRPVESTHVRLSHNYDSIPDAVLAIILLPGLEQSPNPNPKKSYVPSKKPYKKRSSD